MKSIVSTLLGLTLLFGGVAGAQTPQEDEKVIYLAGGCFWGMEKLMSCVPGVLDAVSGYANGTTANPTYGEVCAGDTLHRETVRVTYDPDQVSLEALLSVYFSAIDPAAKNRQGNDVGTQYQSGVYYADEADRAVIEKVMATEKERCPNLAVELSPLTCFYEAEAYHQDYLEKNPGGYCHIGPAAFERAKNLIVDPAAYTRPTDEALRESLSALQYAVTREAATEPPFENEYWNQNADGLYVDVTTSEPLFTSRDKYESSCGWPAFGKSLDDNAMIYSEDTSHFMRRTEVRSRVGNAHLGHVFPGDPESPTGTRYCINSASLRFIPYEDMDIEGYGAYKPYVKPVE